MISPRRPSAVPGPVPVASEEALQKPAAPLLDAKGHEGNRWAAQIERLGHDAPAALASTLRRCAPRVEDETSLRATLAELGYDDAVAERASRRARGGMRRPRFVRTAALAFLAAALAAQGNLAVEPMRGGFTRAANKALEGKFARYIRATGERGVTRAHFGRVWSALADHANQHGWCFPSIPTLAREAWVSERTVQRVIVITEQIGHCLIFPREMERGVPPEWEGAPEEEIAGGRSHMFLLLPAGLDGLDEEDLAPVADVNAVEQSAGSPVNTVAQPTASSPAKVNPVPSPPASASASSTRSPTPARQLIAPSGREAVLAAIRAHPELAPLDNPADVDSLAAAVRKKGKEPVVAKAFGELAKKLREGKYEAVDRLLAHAFLRDVLAPGESDEERLAAENADLPPPRVCREVLGAVARRAEEEAAAKDLVPPPAPVPITAKEGAALLAVLAGRAAEVDAADKPP